MQQFDETLAIIQELNTARDKEEICKRLLQFTTEFGLDRLIAGTQPDPRSSARKQQEHAILSGWPEGWMERYTAEKYAKIDPIIKYGTRNLNPFHWEDARTVLDRSDPGNRFMNEAGDFGLKAGIAIPLVTMDGTMALLSLGGENPEIPPLAMGMISLISTYAIARALQINAAQTRSGAEHLTRREMECMRWAAEGKSEWEISIILGISEHTSEKHLLNARAKLGAVNRTQAVAEAIRRGYIT